VDADADGMPDTDATGDDVFDGTDDEDGVTWPVGIVRGESNEITVTASASGLLNAWIDFYADGDWSDAGEQIFTDQPLAAGANVISFVAPGDASIGNTYARVRYSTAGGLGDCGPAPDGEVEDYLVGVLVPVELNAFSAAAVDGAVMLRWATQSESDNFGFHIYRSSALDGAYDRVTESLIRGAGTSAIPHEYSFVDRGVEAGSTYYYKLSDVALNGVEAFHGPIRVDVPTHVAVLSLDVPAPNPVRATAQIQYTLPSAGMTRLVLYNVAGRVEQVLARGAQEAGSYSLLIDGERLSPGLYLLRLETASGVTTQKIIIAG
jgi:hypothetical protein